MDRYKVSLLICAALATTLMMPGAMGHGAHVENFSETQTLRMGPWSGMFFLEPSPVYANEPTEVLVQLYNQETYQPGRDLNLTFTLEEETPEDPTVATPVALSEKADQPGAYLAQTTFEHVGNQTLNFTAVDANGTKTTANIAFRVYPDLPVRIAPVDDHAEFATNHSTPVPFLTLDPDTGNPFRGPEDLRVRFEHWSDDHKTLYFAEERDLQFKDGQWVTDYTFRSQGMYHLFFASDSMDFDYEDVPLLHLYAFDDVEPEGKAVPGPALATVGLAMLVALACVALPAARRRRG